MDLSRSSHRWWLGAVLGVAGLGLAACGGGGGSTPAANGSPSGGTSTAVLKTASTSMGTVLEDQQGKVVYEFAADSPNHSSCTGSCLTYWPVVKAPAHVPSSVPGVTGKVGVITRSDGTKQLTINGWPLYTYIGDSSPGMTSGQGLNISGGLWWVVSPAGTTITSSSPSPSGSTSSSGGGGAGGGWG